MIHPFPGYAGVDVLPDKYKQLVFFSLIERSDHLDQALLQILFEAEQGIERFPPVAGLMTCHPPALAQHQNIQKMKALFEDLPLAAPAANMRGPAPEYVKVHVRLAVIPLPHRVDVADKILRPAPA